MGRRTGTRLVLESVDDHGFMQIFGDGCTRSCVRCRSEASSMSSLSLPIKISFSSLARLGFGTGGKGTLTAIAPLSFSD